MRAFGFHHLIVVAPGFLFCQGSRLRAICYSNTASKQTLFASRCLGNVCALPIPRLFQRRLVGGSARAGKAEGFASEEGASRCLAEVQVRTFNPSGSGAGGRGSSGRLRLGYGRPLFLKQSQECRCRGPIRSLDMAVLIVEGKVASLSEQRQVRYDLKVSFIAGHQGKPFDESGRSN